MWYLWLAPTSGNANFIFFQTIVYQVGKFMCVCVYACVCVCVCVCLCQYERARPSFHRSRLMAYLYVVTTYDAHTTIHPTNHQPPAAGERPLRGRLHLERGQWATCAGRSAAREEGGVVFHPHVYMHVRTHAQVLRQAGRQHQHKGRRHYVLPDHAHTCT